LAQGCEQQGAEEKSLEDVFRLGPTHGGDPGAEVVTVVLVQRNEFDAQWEAPPRAVVLLPEKVENSVTVSLIPGSKPAQRRAARPAKPSPCAGHRAGGSSSSTLHRVPGPLVPVRRMLRMSRFCTVALITGLMALVVPPAAVRADVFQVTPLVAD